MIGRTNVGGGTSLNFKVVGGTSAPSNPKENTIWVNTDKEITSWHFGTEEPNFYNIKSDEEGYCLYAPHKLTEGEIINFIVPKTITMGFEWVRFVDGTGQDYCVRNGGGAQLEVWPAGKKMSVKISNDLCTMGEYRVRTAYVYGFDNYYHEEGTVWISTGTSSTVEFNALKKNGIQVYPLAAKQYVSGAWVTKTAKSYQGGKWVDWTTFLFANGNQFTDLTGGWGVKSSSGVTCTIGDTLSLRVTGTAAREGSVYTKNKIDVSNFHTLYVDVNVTTIDYSFRIGLSNAAGIKSANELGGYVAQTSTTKTGQQTLSLNVENFNSSYYIVIYTDVATATVSNVRLV